MDFLFRFQIGSTFHQVLYITVVHTDDHIKMIKIFRTDRTGTMGQIVTAAGSMHPHTAVGQFPSMITQDSGRIHLYLVFQSFFLYESTHHFFCRRRPANVTKADKKYSFHI